ncbi:MAG: beta-galactosidase [Bacteroidaceae bacterium]|nr:beta-galactosidase [Bacteroidaceae bacterium]MBP9636804.1 beta-galactosidase [Bacteroidaceae bacterium]
MKIIKCLLFFLVMTSGLSLHAQYKFDTVLYGAAYYDEYNPTERLDEDIRMMKDCGLTVVRIGESSWGLFEPREGVFEFEWMDRILSKLNAAGIKVILGTPTYSIPAWMAERHPEVLAQYTEGRQSSYGIRQNMDITNPTYRFYSERIIRKMMERYAKNPAIIGYQVDNECETRGINNHDYFDGFRNYLKDKYKDLQTLNKVWGLNYWGMNINTWEDLYPRDGVTSPAYKNEWERWNRKSVADFLNWQATIVNEYKRKDQFVTHCFMTAFQNVDQVESFKQMQSPGINIYHDVQDSQDGQSIAYGGDFMRTVAGGNYIVTETNAQGTGWDSKYQRPPYDGQLRQNVYSHLASGSNMVEYWHWSTLHYGQETYWKGVLGHDQQPNRVYDEFKATAQELKKVGKELVNLKKENKVAILYSHDSYFGLRFMPYKNGDNYPINLVYDALYRQNIETDIIPCDKKIDFSRYKMLVIPPLYIASDSLLNAISDFVKNGGEVVMLYKSGFCNEESTVRNVLAPGPLRSACGFHYQEFSYINSMELKDNAFDLKEKKAVSTWMEFLIPETAKPLAYVDHPFFGKWPCITENSFGKGHLIYIATVPTGELMQKMVVRAAERAQLETPALKYSFPLIIRSGVNEKGKKIHYVFNYSADKTSVASPAKGKDLLSGKSFSMGDEIVLDAWGVAILEE